MIDPDIFLIIALILISTKAFAVFMKRFHLPQVIGALLAGVLMGPAVIGFIEPNGVISVIAEFGVIFLLFSAGLETDFRQLRKTLKSSLVISALGVVLALVGGLAAALLFGFPPFESFFIGIIIASMSTSITVEALSEMGKLKSTTGTALLGASLFDDIFVIIILAVTMGMNGSEFNIGSIMIIIVKIIAFLAFAVFSGFCINKLFNWLYGKFGNRGRFTIFAIAYCFLMAYLAELFGLADITGAYIAGIAFSSTRNAQTLETKTHELSYMIFTPVFLANIGLHTSFSGMTSNMLLFTALLVGVAIVSKLVGCGFGAKICRFSNRESVQIGVGMVARGEVSFIVAAKGIAAGYVSTMMYPSVIIVVLVTVLITPLLLKAAFAEKKGILTDKKVIIASKTDMVASKTDI